MFCLFACLSSQSSGLSASQMLFFLFEVSQGLMHNALAFLLLLFLCPGALGVCMGCGEDKYIVMWCSDAEVMRAM